MKGVVIAFYALAALSGSALTTEELFDGGELQDIWVHINARDWQQLRDTYLQNTYYPCAMEWRGMTVRNAGCRSRGSGSRNGAKPGLKIEFDHYVTGQTFLGLTSLVLDNLWQDPSMIRERVSMLLFERMGLPAPRESHARLYIGSARDFTGVYAVIEDVDSQFVDRHYGERGYLYEYRWIDKYDLSDLGPDLEPYAVRFEPRMRTHESAFTLFAPIRDMVLAIAAAPESALEEMLAPHLDLEEIVTYLATENFLSEMDGFLGGYGLNNFYLYRPGMSRGAQLIPWDKDQTFLFLEMPPWHNVGANPLTRKIWAAPQLRRTYLTKLIEATSHGEWLLDEIDRQYELIRAAVMADPLKPASNEEFEQAIEELKRFARERAAIVQRYIGQLAGGS